MCSEGARGATSSVFTCRLVPSFGGSIRSNKEAVTVQSESDEDTVGGSQTHHLHPSALSEAEETNTQNRMLIRSNNSTYCDINTYLHKVKDKSGSV